MHVLLDCMCLYNRGIVISNQTTDKHSKILKCPIFPPSLIQFFFSSNRSFTEAESARLLLAMDVGAMLQKWIYRHLEFCWPAYSWPEENIDVIVPSG